MNGKATTLCCVKENKMVTENILSTELETFEKHKNDLIGKAEGKYVLIKRNEIKGTYDSEMDAIAEGYKEFGNSPFLVKLITSIESPANFVGNNLGV